MSFIKRWNVEDIVRQINSAYYVCSDPNHDGFTTWGVKQDLYQIKMVLDEVIKKCPTFSPEEQWLKDLEKQKVIKYLSKE